ncbi:MAG: RNA methyltransferase [Phycisphaerae bacterium]|nr:RNA methyltransferase [Phycisphaerae bacterium]
MDSKYDHSNISIVTSLEDSRVDLYRSVRDADLRGRRHLCMVESEMVVRRLLDSSWKVHSLFLSPQKYERLAPYIKNPLLDVYVADVSLMSSISGFHIHRGTLALVHRPDDASLGLHKIMQSLESKDMFSLLLAEGITNVDNMGALFRNAAAFGVDAIVLDRTCCDPLYRKAIRVSMGHALSVPWAVVDDWATALSELKDNFGVKLIGCETGNKAKPMWEVDPSQKWALIMGEEKSGLSAHTISLCDELAEIPMTPRVPSINVAVASAVGLYEFLGRRDFDNG